MNRKEFLTKMGIGAAVLPVAACCQQAKAETIKKPLVLSQLELWLNDDCVISKAYPDVKAELTEDSITGLHIKSIKKA